MGISVIKQNIRTGMIRNDMNIFYALKDFQELGKFYNVISGDGFINLVKNLFTKSADAVSSLRAYPVKKNKLGFGSTLNTRTFMVGDTWDFQSYDFEATTDAILIGQYSFSNPSSFIDLAPYTSIQLYLPYMDFIDLPVNEILGKTLEIYYAFDLSSGTATAYIVTYKVNQQGVKVEEHVIAIKTGKIAVDVAWGKDNSIENTKNIINTAFSTAISVTALAVTGGGSTAGEIAKTTAKIGIGTALSKGVLSVMNSLQIQYTRGGTSGSFGSMYAPTSPYLIIKKPKLVPINEGLYAHTYGLPLYESRTLSTLSGFTIVDQIHLEGFTTALDEEVNEIERLLKTGVHL